ncbi:hypothetical protein ACN28E_24250 [Archangium lansingense]|uniref:hypothetical protein n=1 Tax=Archangium lansingense TaxID=2995310 RepID=UPI003B826B9E
MHWKLGLLLAGISLGAACIRPVPPEDDVLDAGDGGGGGDAGEDGGGAVDGGVILAGCALDESDAPPRDVDAGPPRCGLLAPVGGSRIKVKVLVEPGGAELPRGYFDVLRGEDCRVIRTPKGIGCLPLTLSPWCTDASLDDHVRLSREQEPIGSGLAVTAFVGEDGSRLYDEFFTDLRHETEVRIDGSALMPMPFFLHYQSRLDCTVDLALQECPFDGKFVSNQGRIHRACSGDFLAHHRCEFQPPRMCGEAPCQYKPPFAHTMVRFGSEIPLSVWQPIPVTKVKLGTGRFRYTAYEVACAQVPVLREPLEDTLRGGRPCWPKSGPDGGMFCRPDISGVVAYLDPQCTQRVARVFFSKTDPVLVEEGPRQGMEYFPEHPEHFYEVQPRDAGVGSGTVYFVSTDGGCVEGGTTSYRQLGEEVPFETFGRLDVELR